MADQREQAQGVLDKFNRMSEEAVSTIIELRDTVGPEERNKATLYLKRTERFLETLNECIKTQGSPLIYDLPESDLERLDGILDGAEDDTLDD